MPGSSRADASTPPAPRPAIHPYHWSQRIVHWLTVLLVVPAVALGALIGNYGFDGLVDAFGSAATDTIYTWHKSFGVLMLALIVVRLILRGLHGQPTGGPVLPVWQQRLAHWNHAALYLLLTAMPLLGWAATATGGFPVQLFAFELPPLFPVNRDLSPYLFTAHYWVGLTLVALILLHVAAALQHALVRHDGVMQRMLAGTLGDSRGRTLRKT